MNKNRRRPLITVLDGVVLIVAAGFLFYLTRKASQNLNYHWNWGVVSEYLIRRDPVSGAWIPNHLVQGLLMTIRLSVWSIVLATAVGVVMGMFRISGSLFRRLLSKTYVECVRNLPPLVLIFLFYFFISEQIMALAGIEALLRNAPDAVRHVVSLLVAPPEQVTAFIPAVITLALYEGAYMTEIVRSGIESIAKGQWEAAGALGMSKRQQMAHVILPQAVRRILPPMAGQFISTIKDSSIVSLISIQELTFQGMELNAATYRTFEIWITITVMYFVLTFSCSLGAGYLEHRLYGRQRC